MLQIQQYMMATCPSKVHILDLPSEILVKIFSHLSVPDIVLGVRPTCRRFRKLSWHLSLWVNVNIGVKGTNDHQESPVYHAITEDVSLNLLHQKFIRNEDEEDTEQSGDRNSVTLKDRLRSVCEDNEDDEIVPEYSVTGQLVFPRLQKINLWNTCLPEPSFLSRYNGLLHLELMITDYEEELHGYFLEDLFERLKSLKKLLAVKIDFLNRCTPTDPVAASIQNYFLSAPKLRGVYFNFDVCEDIVAAIVLHCLELKELEFGPHVSKITSEAFKAVSQNPNLSLKALSFWDCSSIDSSVLFAVAQGFPNLDTFHLLTYQTKTTNKGMKYLLERCSSLAHLDLNLVNSERAVDDDEETRKNRRHFLLDLASHKRQRNLQSLCLEDFKDLSFVQHIFQNQCNLLIVKLIQCSCLTGEALQALAENCPWLHTLVILTCDKIKVSATTVSTLLTLPHLQTLKVDSGSFVEKVAKFRDNPPCKKRKIMSGELNGEAEVSRLQELWIPSRSLVFTPSRLELFERTCRGLQFLVIYENQLMDDHNLKVILRCCVHLKELQLKRSFPKALKHGNLSDASLRYIEIYGLQLQALTLPHCPGITIKGVARLAVRSPSLIEFHYDFSYKKVGPARVRMASELTALIKSKLAKRFCHRKVQSIFPNEMSETVVKLYITRMRTCDGVGRCLRSGKRSIME